MKLYSFVPNYRRRGGGVRGGGGSMKMNQGGNQDFLKWGGLLLGHSLIII